MSDLRRRLYAAAPLFARIALGLAFLSAVADRFGLWGPPGAPGVAWGALEPFFAYTGTVNPWFPAAAIPAVGWAVTIAEIVLGLALLAGWRLRDTALAGAALLFAFGVGMAAGSGIKSPLDASVFAASAAALLLAARSDRGGAPAGD